ncbi:MAG: WYL domain-containing protein [Bacteroidetes bacterium]|nr:MAG: WYL domain-containing protein [Bacteroidota bacterium]
MVVLDVFIPEFISIASNQVLLRTTSRTLPIFRLLRSMSSLVAKIRRFQIIMENLKKRNCTKRDLMEKLSEQGFEMSERTLDRDIEELRREFDADILYSRNHRAYVLEQESGQADRLERILELNQVVQAMQSSLHLDAKFRDRIQFEAHTMKGTELLEDLMRFIREEREVDFDHLNYQTGAIKPYAVYPLLLKEYSQRWYLYAWVPELSDCRTFGLDRILHLKPGRDTFISDRYTDNFRMFEQVIGVNYSDHAAPVEVRLQCTQVQASYLESAPWHKSMKRLADVGEFAQFSLNVIPNYELTQKILSLSKQVEVLTPVWYREQIKEHLDDMTKLY